MTFGLLSFHSTGVVVNNPAILALMFGVGIIIATIGLMRSVFRLSQVKNPIDGRVRRRENGERLRMDYVVSGIIMLIPATGFAVFAAWSWDDAVVHPTVRAYYNTGFTNQYWTVLVLTLLATTILYLAGSMLIRKGIRDPGYIP